jgi:hypothetical protein
MAKSARGGDPERTRGTAVAARAFGVGPGLDDITSSGGVSTRADLQVVGRLEAVRKAFQKDSQAVG